MVFYEVELLTSPKILFACHVETEKHRTLFYNRENFIEISVCEEGHMVFDHKDKESEISSAGMIVPILCDTNCDAYSQDNKKQRHTTVGVRVGYKMKRYEDESECDFDDLTARLRTGNVILIPHFFNPGEKISKILSSLAELISYYSTETPEAPILAVSRWYKLCSIATDIAYTEISNYFHNNFKPSEQMYVKRAVKYIEGINKSQLSIKDIADSLNISEGYLHRIFKKITGSTILEYINRQRISAMIELIENKNLTLQEAAYNVGIEDPAYASRLFKKVTGISYREYFSLSASESKVT